MIKLAQPSLKPEDMGEVGAVLSSGMLVQGEYVARFEDLLRNYTKLPETVVLSSGTAALHLALLAAGIKPGDRVIVPAYSWIATANVVEQCGAIPLFVDIDAETWNISIGKLQETIEALSTASCEEMPRAIIPVHLFGSIADMHAITVIARKYRISIIEDAACALGAHLDGQHAGAFGRYGCFSFHPRKILTTGEGGAVVTRDSDGACLIRALRNHGQNADSCDRQFIAAGYNYRMTDFQAALGVAQLSRFDELISKRRKQAKYYNEHIRGISIINSVQKNLSLTSSVYQAYVCMLKSEYAGIRDDVIRDFRERGVEAGVGTIHMPLTSYFRDKYHYSKGDFTATDIVAACSLSLPIHDGLTVEDQDVVLSHMQDLSMKYGRKSNA